MMCVWLPLQLSHFNLIPSMILGKKEKVIWNIEQYYNQNEKDTFMTHFKQVGIYSAIPSQIHKNQVICFLEFVMLFFK